MHVAAFNPASELNCDVGDPSRRVNCGYAGIHANACRQRNCCSDESVPGVPWCFYGVNSTAVSTSTHLPTDPTAHCKVPQTSRKQCGMHEVDREQCVHKGCCWQTSIIYGVPSCYYASTKPRTIDCNLQLPKRRSCGYSALNKKQCTAKGCCWDDTASGREKCYRPNTGQSLLLSSTISS